MSGGESTSVCCSGFLDRLPVEDLRQGNAYHGQNLPVHIVQKVIGDISQRLVNLAAQDIIHGGKSNYLFHEHSS